MVIQSFKVRNRVLIELQVQVVHIEFGDFLEDCDGNYFFEGHIFSLWGGDDPLDAVQGMLERELESVTILEVNFNEIVYSNY
jgi:hypothetical protein